MLTLKFALGTLTININKIGTFLVIDLFLEYIFKVTHTNCFSL